MLKEKINLELIKILKVVYKVLYFKQIKYCLEELDLDIRNRFGESIYNSNFKNLASFKIKFSRRLEHLFFLLKPEI